MLGSFKSAFQAPRPPHPPPSPCSVELALQCSWGMSLELPNPQKVIDRSWSDFQVERTQHSGSLGDYCLSGLEGGAWGRRGLAWGPHSGCITWIINISMSHGCHWRNQLRFGRASAKEPSLMSALLPGPILHSDTVPLKWTREARMAFIQAHWLSQHSWLH